MIDFFNTPVFMNRSLIAWINLLIGILNLYFAFTIADSKGLIILNSVVFGMCFASWIWNDSILKLHKIIDKCTELNTDMLKFMKKIMDELIASKY